MIRSLSRTLHRSRLSTPALLLSSSLALCAVACGAQSQTPDDGSTDTGNPPVIDVQKLNVEESDAGVVVTGEAGAVTAGARVTVTNKTEGSSEATTAAEDGSFEVSLPGSVDDEYEIEAKVGSKTTTEDLGADDSLDGLTFLMQSSEGFTPIEGTSVQLRFDETELSFTAGCNQHFGSYSLCGDQLCVDDMGSTAIGCDTERHEQDEWLATFLTSRPLFERDGDALTLSTDEASLNFLDSEVANPDRSLTDRTWTIDTFVRGGSASNLSLQEEPTVRFDADGTVRVFTTCNTGGGQYTASGNTLQLEAIAYTEEGCNETGSASAEQHIQEVLTEGEVQFEIDAARLTLSRGDVGLMAISE